jgi:RimJ/RimL family protein N-acetyltransferase
MAPETVWEPYGREITEIVKLTIERVLSTGLAHRIETVTLADQSRARTWYEKIGLTYESTLRKFGVSGEDAVMYVAVRDAETN